MALTRLSIAPGEVIRAWYDNDIAPSENRWDWRIEGAGNTLHPVQVECLQGIRCAELHMPGLQQGEYTVYAPDGSSTCITWRPCEEYFWLNIRGLPADPCALFEPDNDRKDRCGPSDNGIVVGGEYFNAREISGVGSRLDIQQLRLSADRVQIRLVDLDGRLKQLFACMPQQSTRVLLHYDHEGGGTIVEDDIGVERYDYLWTELGECVQLTTQPVTDDSGVHIMLQRACHDSVESIIRPGMRLYRYPLLSTLFAEVWRWRPEEGSTRLYVGQISEITPQASGLEWHLSIGDLISGSTVLRPARGCEHPLNVLPWEYQLTTAWVMERTLLQVFGERSSEFWYKLLQKDFTGQIGYASLFSYINLKTCIYMEISRKEPGAMARDDIQYLSGRGYQIIDYEVTPAQHKARMRLAFSYAQYSDYIIIKDCDNLLTEGFVNTRDGRYKVVENPPGEIDVFLSMHIPNTMYLKREPRPLQPTRQSDLESLWEDRNGYHPFTNNDNLHTLGYWDRDNPRIVVQSDDEEWTCKGIARVPHYVRNRGEYVIATDGYDDALKLYDTPAPDERELVESLPYAHESYGDVAVGGELKTSLSSLLCSGREADGLRPPLRGLGIPAEYVTLTDHPALESLPATGWTQGDVETDELLAQFARASGVAVGIRSDGSVGVVPCLWRPYDSVALAVPLLNIANAIEPPQVVRVEPPGARELHISLDNDAYVVCNTTGLGTGSDAWEVPSFSQPWAIADIARRVLSIVGTPRQIVSLRFPESALERPVGGGDWIRLKGPMPGTLWTGGDEVDCFALVLSASRNLYSGIMDIEMLLTPEDNPETRGFHWGSSIEAWQNGYLYLPRDAGVDFGDIYPPGMGSTSLDCRIFDGTQWCEDYFELSSPQRCTINNVDCYRFDVSTWHDTTSAARAMHPVTISPGNHCITIGGDFAHQFRKGLRVFCNDPTIAPAIVSDVSVTGGNTLIAADWSNDPPANVRIWGEVLQLAVAPYDDDSLGSHERSYYFYGDPQNTAIDTWYAPGARIWTVGGISHLVGVDGLTVEGDITADFIDVSAQEPVTLYFAPPRQCNDQALSVQSADYSSINNSTLLTLCTTSGDVQTGDRFRDNRRGRRWLSRRPGATVADMREAYEFSQ